MQGKHGHGVYYFNQYAPSIDRQPKADRAEADMAAEIARKAFRMKRRALIVVHPKGPLKLS